MVLNEINTVKPFSFLSLSCVRVYLALENSRHFTTPQLVSRKMMSLTGLRNERRNSILMTRHYPDLGSASDWLNQISHTARPIRSTTHIWVVTRHQYGISALVSQTSFRGETSGSVVKCRLFYQVRASPPIVTVIRVSNTFQINLPEVLK